MPFLFLLFLKAQKYKPESARYAVSRSIAVIKWRPHKAVRLAPAAPAPFALPPVSSARRVHAWFRLCLLARTFFAGNKTIALAQTPPNRRL